MNPRASSLEVIVAKRIRKVYWPNVALDDVDLSIEGPGVHVIVGPNGSGKSTLLSILAGAERPSSGYARVLGLDPWRDSSKLAPRVRALLDRVSLPVWLPCIDIARATAKITRTPWQEILGVAEALGVDTYWERPYGAYSTGMRRKCLLLLAFTGKPEVIMLDEPFQALDMKSRETIVDMISEKAEKGTTVLVATHIIPEKLEKQVKTIIKMELGKIVEIKKIE
ncbi:MAG: ATP-binding cassette domain-containing protein [Desulfurococcales archaeon]|nr:ATP-binding cassette domain-containing protein [Desulfurococcales archaeon]